jgi:hypothetical protein
MTSAINFEVVAVNIFMQLRAEGSSALLFLEKVMQREALD